MPNPNRPLNGGKIAALKRLKLAYDDADDAGEEPRQFAVMKDELMAGGATSSDVLWLLKMRYVNHVREVTQDGEPRRQFRAATSPTLAQDSCFFLTYAGNVYVVRNRTHRAAPAKPRSGRAAKSKLRRDDKPVHRRNPAKRRGEPRSAGSRVPPPGEQEKLAWKASEGNFYWRAQVILHLATQASAERAVLDEFERWHWETTIRNPLPRDPLSDSTQSRRSAVKNLNKRLGKESPIGFFCHGGDFVSWKRLK